MPRVRPNRVYSPADLGMNAATAANGTPVTSSAFSVVGVSSVSVYVFLDYAAATRLDVALRLSPVTGEAATLFYIPQSETTVAGTATLSDYEAQHTLSSADDRVCFKFKNIDAVEGRLVIEGVGGTTDTITVHVVCDG